MAISSVSNLIFLVLLTGEYYMQDYYTCTPEPTVVLAQDTLKLESGHDLDRPYRDPSL